VPVPVPGPLPVPVPAPLPVPVPAPPAPVVVTAPVPAPAPATVVAPAPATVVVTAPAPAPATVVVTAPAPATVVASAPAPVVGAAPAPTPLSEATGDPVAPAPPPVAGVIQTTFVVTLPPGKTEMSARLTALPAAQVLSSFTGLLGDAVGVTSATVTMTTPPETGLAGSVLLAVTDTSAAGVQSAASQTAIRTAIADLAGVWFGDVGAVTFSSADGTLLTAPAAADTNAPNTAAGLGTDEGTDEATGRRLTPGSVSAGFTISVPGARAQGYSNDCSMKHVQAGALSDIPDTNTFTTLVGVAVTPDSCAGEAAQRSQDLWSFTTVAGGESECRMSSWAHITDATWVAGAVTQIKADDCAAMSCPTTAPTGVWPGADAAASNAAFGGHQPFNLMCWPKNSDLALMQCGETVVQTTDNDWPGTCNNLNASPTTGDGAVTTVDDCRTACVNNPFCSVWMWATPSTTADDASTNACYTGVGNQCWTSAGDGGAIGTITKAERMQHGQVNVLKDDLTDRVLVNLQQQFGEDVQVTNASGVLVGMSEAEQKENCRLICHSNIECTFWQSFYSDGTGTDLGCWTEAPGVDAVGGNTDLGQYVPYPTTLQTEAEGGAFRPDDGDTSRLTGGQYIQHFCPEPTLPTRPPATTTTTTTTVVELPALAADTPEEGGFMNPWGYILIVGTLLVALVALALMVLGQPKAKKRAVNKIKTKPKPPPAPEPPPVQQPIVPLLIPHPQLQTLVQPTYAAPLAMTTIQQPTTYAAQAVAQPYMRPM